MVQAIGAAAGTLLGAFSGQSRRDTDKARPQYSSAAPAMAAAKDSRTANKIAKEAAQERFYTLLSQPEVLGYLMALGGLIISNKIPFSDDHEKNTVLQAISSTMTVAMGMGFAGVGDLTSLSVAMAAGGGSLIGGLVDLNVDLPNVSDIWDKLNPLSPIAHLIGLES